MVKMIFLIELRIFDCRKEQKILLTDIYKELTKLQQVQLIYRVWQKYPNNLLALQEIILVKNISKSYRILLLFIGDLRLNLSNMIPYFHKSKKFFIRFHQKSSKFNYF